MHFWSANYSKETGKYDSANAEYFKSAKAWYFSAGDKLCLCSKSWNDE